MTIRQRYDFNSQEKLLMSIQDKAFKGQENTLKGQDKTFKQQEF